jgi:ArsR family transcriptional regulator
MELEVAAQGFAALGSEARLQVVLTLVMKFLSSGSLVTQEKAGRSVINRAAFDHLEGLAGYILKECCAEEGCQGGLLGERKAAND